METKQSQTSPAARENIMGTMEINPLLVKLSVPMMISMLVQALYNVVDSVFVSHVSESALTAVSLAFSLQNVMIAVGVGTGVGVNALLSKSLGEKNQHRANVTAENGIFLSLCSFVVFLVIGLTCMKPYFYAQTSDAAIAQQGIQYDEYSKATGMDESKLIDDAKEPALRQVRMDLATAAIIKAENIEASEEEVSAEIKRIADQYKMEEDKVRELVNVNDLKKDLAINKAIDFIKSHANIVEKAAEEEKAADAE